MREFLRDLFGRAVERAIQATGHTREELAYQVLPLFLLDIINRYLRVQTEGEENIPDKGPYLVIANHSGFMGFDALMLAHQIYLKKKRVPRIIAHKLWFLMPEISVHAHKLGLVPATFDNGLALLQRNQPLVLFPEGEEGNFKPSRYRYKLRRFRRGFVRLALKTGAPIVPAVVIGAEETHITLSQIKWAKEILGIIVPVPLNVIPLPARWHIKFFKPVILEKDPDRAANIQEVSRIAQEIRVDLQHKMHEELRKRSTVFV